MKKRILSIILVLLMAAALLLSFSLPAMAAFSATIRMTLDGQPMSPTAIVSSEATLFAYTPALSFSQFTESPTGTFTASNIQDDANTLAIGNGGGYTNIRDRLVDFHSMVSKTPFTISNTTAYPLTLVFYSVSYKPGTYAKETTSTYKRIAAEGRGQYAQNSTYTRDGYIQIGWSTDPDGTSKTYDFGAEIYPTSAMNLYPAWAEPTFPVTVKVNKDGSAWTGHGKSLALYQSGAKKYDLPVSGSSATVSALAGTYDIYEGTSDTGMDVTVSNGGANSATVNYYTLTLSAGAGTSLPTGGGIYLAGKSVPIDATVNPGYTWSKWTSSSTGLLSDQSTKATNISMPVGAVTLAAMSTLNTYTITWRKTAGEVIDTTTVAYDATPTHSDPTNPGYNFAGWNPSVVSVTGDATYTAQWTPATYSISYTLNGGTATNPAGYTFPNPAITLNNPTRAGYSFVGWSGTDLTGNTNQTVTIVASSTGDKSYTSNWKANAPSAPLASIVTAKTDRSFTITTQTWYEYSVDGTNWHSGTDGSYTFAGLTAGTACNLFCRVAAVTTGDTSAASNASDPLTVTTKSTGSVPTPTLASVTYASAKTLADITLPSGWAWSAPATVPTVAINSYSAAYTPTDTTTVDYSGEAGYANASGTVTITRTIALTINRATPTAAGFTYTAPLSLDYNAAAKTAAVAAKGGISGMGTVTVKYYQGGTEIAAPTNVGTYTVKIDIAQGDNYAAATGITDEVWTFTIAKVAQAPLSITNKPASITYGDSFTLAAAGGSGTGAVTWAVTDGDSATVHTLTGEVTNTGVGETTITVTKAADGNYTAPVTDAYTFTPTKLQLTVALPAVTGGWTKTYDGGSAFDTSAITVGGMMNRVRSDDVTVLVASATYDTANVGAGDKTLTITYAINGADSGNYTVPADTAVNTASITAATPTAADFTYTAPAALDYSGTDKTAAVAVKASISGMGAVTVKYYLGAAETTPTNAGTYTVKIDIAQGDNYAAATGITDDAWTFTIAKVAQAPLSITNKPASITYGDSFTLAAAGGSGTGEMTWAVTNGDSATVHTLTGEVTITGVGETTITVTKAADGNYIAPVTDTYTFTPTKIQLTVALPSANGGWTKTYDGGTLLDTSAITVGGIMNRVWSDDVTVLVASATYDTANVGAGDKILTITYAIDGADSENYAAPADTVVNTASVTAATPTAADFTYTAPAALDYSGTDKTAAVAVKASISGMGAVNVKYYLGTAETTPTNAGTYTVKIDIAQGDNYAAATGITDDAWTFTIAKIAQAPLSITNKPAGITYGDSFTLAAAGGSGTGAVTWAVTDGDSATVHTLTGEVTITGVGETTITATKAADGNYIAPVTDTYTFTPTRFQLTVALPAVTGGWTKTYDGGTAFDTSAITVGGMMNRVRSDDVTVLVASATYDTANVGTGDKLLTITYAIDGADSENYTVPADTAINTASVTAAIPTVALVRKTSPHTGSIIHVEAATVTGVASEDDITANYAGAVTYIYYTKDTCTDADKTTVDKSGALAVGGAPKNAGTYYVKATITANGNYAEAASTVATLTIYYRSSGEDKSSSPVIIDGMTVDMGTTEVTDNTTTVVVVQSKMTEQLKSVKDSVVIPITARTETASAQLVVRNVERMAERGVSLTIIAGDVSYSIPSGAIDTSAALEALDASDSSKVPLTIAISKLPNSSVTIQNGTLMVPPVAFTVTATYNGKSVTVERFGSYVQRVIEIPDGTDPKTITTAVVVEADGTQRHVPTMVYSENGKWYARINAMTNSTYALIHNSVSFADTKGKWYDASVTEMASRGIISGIGENMFAGERVITRAEFAAILVRALGLPSDSMAAEAFSDVSTNQWYYGSVGTAYEYGLVTDKGEGLFDPTGNITKQEAMAMIASAAELAGYEDNVDNSTGFSDVDEIVAWAFDAVKSNVSSGLIVGSNDQIHPTDNISHAETAVVILRLLQAAELVDVRN